MFKGENMDNFTALYTLLLVQNRYTLPLVMFSVSSWISSTNLCSLSSVLKTVEGTIDHVQNAFSQFTLGRLIHLMFYGAFLTMFFHGH